MRVVVAGRRGGKTTRMVAWLLEGHAIDTYPGWSRAIVCANTTQVISTARMVREATKDWPESRSLWDLRKAIWSVDDLRSVMRGMKLDDFEYVVDNADMILMRALGANKEPSTITMTGESEDE